MTSKEKTQVHTRTHTKQKENQKTKGQFGKLLEKSFELQTLKTLLKTS